jgi:hypothetical protein
MEEDEVGGGDKDEEASDTSAILPVRSWGMVEEGQASPMYTTSTVLLANTALYGERGIGAKF